MGLINMKLWSKGYDVDKLIEEYTVGNDFELDSYLIKFDVIASKAHAKMLFKQSHIKEDELNLLLKGLDEIMNLSENNKFTISQEDEDCHTAIEKYLTENYGDVGKKIHLGRSRNDQVLVALRLFYLDKIKQIQSKIDQVNKTINEFILKYPDVPIPGYTHMQFAMPSSIKMWSESFIFALSDYKILLDSVEKVMNQNPLGSAAGFGVPLDIDKEYTAKELNFKSIQSNPMYCQLSRGNFEGQFLSTMSGIMHILNKIASDVILFSMPHFGYISLPKELTTGSSIMPNKKNPDVLEILRANYSVALGKEFEVKSIIGNLISGYNRDIQLTKKPMFEAINILESSLEVVVLLFSKLVVNEMNCKKWMLPELYATEEAYNLVKKGKSFRDAYEEIGRKFV